ncbi:hypothetical protein Tco_0625863 [Tanacetum coccineum]|uniref:Uncharacterized protein n=1 Tax=Tanacetum coccineum TaxID=301880 RepID=A0ABQ4WI15_9ASTR
MMQAHLYRNIGTGIGLDRRFQISIGVSSGGVLDLDWSFIRRGLGSRLEFQSEGFGVSTGVSIGGVLGHVWRLWIRSEVGVVLLLDQSWDVFKFVLAEGVDFIARKPKVLAEGEIFVYYFRRLFDAVKLLILKPTGYDARNHTNPLILYIIKKQCADLKQQKESTVYANEKVSKLTAELGVLKSRCQTVEHKLTSWDKKHRKYRNERDTLSTEKAKIEEELSDFTPLVRRFLKSSEFNRAFAGVLNTTISVGVERGLRMDRTDKEFKGLSQKVVGFIPDAKEKFDRVIVVFPDTTFPFLDMVSQHSQSSLQDIARLEPDMVTSSHQPSSATASLRANTHV